MVRRFVKARGGRWLRKPLLLATYFVLISGSVVVPALTINHYRTLLDYAYSRFSLDEMGIQQVSRESASEPQNSSPSNQTQPKGTLEIQSTPPNSHIYIDGVYAGTSPLRLDGIRQGRHDLLAKRYGYTPARREFEIRSKNLQLHLKLKKQTGQIRLLGPQGTAIWIDGREIGRLPLDPLELSVGFHDCEASFQGRRWKRQMEVRPNVRLTFKIQRDFPPASVHRLEEAANVRIDCQPWGIVFLDGKRKGLCPMGITLSPGRHLLEVKRKGYSEEIRHLALKPGETKQMTIRMEKADH